MMSILRAHRRDTAGLGAGMAAAVATLGAAAALAPASYAAQPGSTSATPINVLSQFDNSVAPGTSPVDSLPATPAETTGGTQYVPSTGGSSSPPAGGDDDYTQDFAFDYGGTPPDSSDGNPDETVQTLDLDLPPGQLDSLAAAADFCTPAELGTMPTAKSAGTGWLGAPPNTGCPADSQIGELAGTVSALGLTLPISGNLYLEPPAAPGDVAEVAAEVESSLGGSWYRAQVASGPISVVQGAGGAPTLQVSLSLPAGATLDDGTVAAAKNLLVPYTLENLTQTINGLTPAGAAFQRFPTSDAQATAITAVTVQNNGSVKKKLAGETVAGVTGSGTASITPTGAGSLSYSPQLSGTVVRDSGDPDVALSTTISQAADEAASHQIVLALPSLLQPNLTNSVTALCTDPNATASNCTPVGTVTAVSPLLPQALVGQVYLTGSASGAALTLTFPPPVALTLTGTVDLLHNTVTFGSVPDLPLTGLTVDIAGGPNGIYETTCTASANTGTVQASFIGQNGATSSSGGAFSISGCPSVAAASSSAGTPAPRLTGTPQVRTSVRHLGARSGRVTVQVRRSGPSTAFTAMTISAPSGLHYNRSALRSAVSVIGTKVKVVTLSHGQLRVVLSQPTRSAFVTIHRAALTVTPSLAHRIAGHRVKSLAFRVGFETSAQQTETVVTSAKV